MCRFKRKNDKLKKLLSIDRIKLNEVYKELLERMKKEWFSNVRADILGTGAVVALALIPEAIAFSIIAGVDPM